MKILLYDIGSYTQKDLIYYLERQGCTCRNILYKHRDFYQDSFFEYHFEKLLLADDYDFVMSTNFSPIVAKICNSHNKKYIAWVYDSPINVDHIEYYQYPTSYIFLFDRIEAQRVTDLGGVNIYHLPLAVNPNRFTRVEIGGDDIATYSADISFIGQFYNSVLKQIMNQIDAYDSGYIDAICESQFRIYGYNFVEEMVSDELISRINKRLEEHGTINELTKRGLIYNINRHITHTERIVLLNMFEKRYNVKYYSGEQSEFLSRSKYCGTAHYYSEMPKIFRLSKLNLNPTLKSIQSGIPLRALDILACKGALMSNYQPELAEYFTDGEDVIMYDSIEDALCKADFYLKNEDIRSQIVENGYQKVLTYFSYPDKIEAMLKTADIL